jgi:hypothetical protein
MHEAAAYPPDLELIRLVDEMHTCLVQVLRM